MHALLRKWWRYKKDRCPITPADRVAKRDPDNPRPGQLERAYTPDREAVIYRPNFQNKE